MKKRAKIKNRKFLLVIFVLVLIGLGVAGYITLHRAPKVQPAPQTTAGTTPGVQTATTAASSPLTSPHPEPAPQVTSYTTLIDNEQYKIRQQDGTDNYIVTLYAIINRPDQYSDYTSQLKEFKQNALQYLKSKGIDVTKVNITYEPTEATGL